MTIKNTYTKLPEIAFRIRQLHGSASARDEDVAEKKYRGHVRDSYRIKDRELWAFFGGDFFENGKIQSIQMNAVGRSLALGIECPNIIHYSRKRHDYEYVTILLECVFRDVRLFAIDNRKTLPEHPGQSQIHFDFYNAADDDERQLIFARAEVDLMTLELEALNDYDDDGTDAYHSLVIQARPDDQMIAIIFKSVAVEGRDQDEFNRMRRSSWYHVPLYRNEMRAAAPL